MVCVYVLTVHYHVVESLVYAVAALIVDGASKVGPAQVERRHLCDQITL